MQRPQDERISVSDDVVPRPAAPEEARHQQHRDHADITK
jgi:hypothetical protein